MRFSDIVNKYSIQDARDLGTFLPRHKQCLDVTITSPPYWNMKDYGAKNQIGYGQGYDQYLIDIEAVFRAVYESTKNTGSLWVVADTFKQDGKLRLLPFDIAERLATSGWLLQDLIIWQKDRTLPWSHQGKLRNIFEYVAFYSKSRRFNYDISELRDTTDLKDYWVRYPERYSPEGKTPSRTWEIPIPRQGSWGKAGNYVNHACPLPIELVERILRLTTRTGDVVLDPFAGSGAVLATARAMGRRFVGTDLSRRHRKMFYDSVLPTVVSRFKARRAAGEDKQHVARRRFASAVLALRCLKFPKELVRLYRATFGGLRVACILAIPSRDRRQLTLIFCLTSKPRSSKIFLSRAIRLVGRRPLSKYGIRPTIIAATSPAAVSRALNGLQFRGERQLFEYTRGRFYWWTGSTTGAALLARPNGLFREAGGHQFPTILSPIRLRISPRYPAKFFEAGHGHSAITKETT